MSMFTMSLALRCAALGCSLAVMVACGSRQTEVVDAGYQPPVFEFTRGDLAGDQQAGFRPAVDPNFPTLPAIVDEATTLDHLDSMALQVALSEQAKRLIALEEVDMRRQDILAFWTPQYHILQEVLRDNHKQRRLVHEHQLAEASRRSQWEREQDANRAAWDERIRQEEMRVLPLVPPDLHARLIQQMRLADTQRSRWCAVAP